MPRVVQQDSLALDDLGSIAARFEEDVARVEIFTNGDETEDYLTTDGRAVPSLSKVVANVNEMLRPDLDAIAAAVTATQTASSAAGQSASAAAASASTAEADAADARAAAIATAADAIAVADDAGRADAAADAAGSARDAAVAAQASVQQNADLASGAASRAQASETAAAESVRQTGLDLAAVEELAGEAAGHAVAAGQSATAASENATAASESATAAAQNETAAATSATAAAASADEAATHAASVNPANLVKRAGDTMAGPLKFPQAGTVGQTYQIQFVKFDGTSGPRIAFDPAGGIQGNGIGFLNSAGDTWNFQVGDGGGSSFAATMNIRSGDLNILAGSVNVTGAVNASGGINAGGNIIANVVYSGGGAAYLNTAGDLNGPTWGGWLSTWLTNQINVVTANANGRVPIRRADLANYGLVVSNTVNNIAVNWDGRLYATVDTTFQGYLITSVQLNLDNVLAIGFAGGDTGRPYMLHPNGIYRNLVNTDFGTYNSVHTMWVDGAGSYISIQSGAGAIGVNFFWSDALKKTNVSVNTDSYMHKVEAIDFYRFDFKQQWGGSHWDLGIFSQDIQASCGKEYAIELEDGSLQPDPNRLLVLALKTIQELNQRVAALEGRLATFEGGANHE